MLDLGELEFYISNIDFTNKEELKSKLEELKKNSEDGFAKNSIDTALMILTNISEEDLKKAKGSLNG